jgi:purine nucleoside permease
MLTRILAASAALTFAACAAVSTAPARADDNAMEQNADASHGRPVKVMIISMFGPEGQVWPR